MKTVILLSGQTRTFRHCWRNQYWMLLRKLVNPSFFCCMADDADAPDLKLLRERFEHVSVKLIPQPEPVLPEPDHQLAFHAPFAVANLDHGGIQNLVKQLWGLSETWRYFLEAGAGNFDPRETLIVRLRPDLWFHRCDLPWWVKPFEITKTTLGAVQSDFFKIAYAPWWRSCGGVNDRLALMGWAAAEAWFTTYARLDTLLALGCPLHQESLVAASLEHAGCSVSETLTADFSFVRQEGSNLTLVREQFEPLELARLLTRV